jgi:Tfp pilus assembly protein PilV
MKNKTLLLLSVILLSFVNIQAQETDTFNCAFDSLMLE